MAAYQCKVCGGNIQAPSDERLGVCSACGHTASLPRNQDERRVDAFNLGNYYRRNGEFNKALSTYARLQRKDPDDAEAHWCAALCNAGIVYEENPETHECVPVSYRGNAGAFLMDSDYLAALEHAKGDLRKHYKYEANRIVKAAQEKKTANRQAALTYFEEARKQADQKKLEWQANRAKTIKVLVAAAIGAVITYLLIIFGVFLPSYYERAEALMEAGNYEAAATMFDEMGGYGRSRKKAAECWYMHGLALMNAGQHRQALAVFDTVEGHENASYFAKELRMQLTERETASAGGKHVIAVKTDGRVVTTAVSNVNAYGWKDWTNVIAVSAGGNHALALRSDGTVLSLGDNTYGQCDVGGWRDIIAISAGENHSVGLKSDGTVVAVGDDWGQACQVSGWKDMVAISAGDGQTAGLKSDGTVLLTGGYRYTNGYIHEDSGKIIGWTDMVDISVGCGFVAGLKSDGTVLLLGDLQYYDYPVDQTEYPGGKRLAWTDIVDISANRSGIVGLKKDGTVVVADFENYFEIADWKNVCAITTASWNREDAGRYLIALRSDGSLLLDGKREGNMSFVVQWKNIMVYNDMNEMQNPPEQRNP